MANLLDAIRQALIQQQQPSPMMPQQPQQMAQRPQIPSFVSQQEARPQPQLDDNGQTGFGRFLATMGLPLVSTAVGLASKSALPGAAGFTGGYNTGRQQAFDNNLATREQKRKEELYKSGKGVYQTDPITGELKEVGNVGYRDIVQKGVMSPDQMKDRAVAQGEAEFTKKNMEQSGKLGTAVKRLALLNKQFKKALPSGDKTPLEQRISGNTSAWAAKMGLIDNPELVALKKNVRPMAINLIRLFGEVGNLAQTEQQGAMDIVEQEGLTDEERIAQTRQFIEYALAGANPEGIKMLTSNSEMQGILDAFGVDLGQFSGEQGDDFSSMSDDELRKIAGGM